MASGDLDVDADEWEQLPLHSFDGDAGAFQLRWRPDTLVALVRGRDATPDAPTGSPSSSTTRPTRSGATARATCRRRSRRRPAAGSRSSSCRCPVRRSASWSRSTSVTDGATTRRLERAGRDGHADARRAALVHGRGRGADAAGRSTARSTASGRSRTPCRPTSQVEGAGGATAVVRTLWQRQHAVRPRRGHRRRRPTTPAPTRGSRTRSRSSSTRATSRTGRTASTTPRSGSTARTSTSFGTGDEAFQAPGSRARRRRRRRLRRRGVDQPARVRRRRDVPRARLPGQRRHRRRPDLDPELGRPDRPRLPEHLALGGRAAGRPRRHGAGAGVRQPAEPDRDRSRRVPRPDRRDRRGDGERRVRRSLRPGDHQRCPGRAPGGDDARDVDGDGPRAATARRRPSR